MTFDPKCFDLAKTFLSDHPAIDTETKANELAEVIQSEIDDWIVRHEGRAADLEARRSWS